MSAMFRLLWVFCLSLVPVSAQVCSAAFFGAGNPVTVSGSHTLCPNAVLDFGGRQVIFDASANIAIQTAATIIGGEVVLSGGSSIHGQGAGLTVTATGLGGTSGNLQVDGQVNLSGPAGGGVFSGTATGVILVDGGSGQIKSAGTSSAACGGTVSLSTNGDVVIQGAGTSVDVHSGSGSAGGSINIASAQGLVLLMKELNLNGGAFDGGSATLTSALGLTVGGLITADGSGGCGLGGCVTLTAGGALAVQAVISADGALGPSGGFGGCGGSVTLASGGAMTIAATVRANGGRQAAGGAVSLTAATTFVQSGGTIFAKDEHLDSYGGCVCVAANGGPATLQTVNCNGSATCSGGDLTVCVTGDLLVSGTLTSTGNCGGTMTLTASGALMIPGTLDVSAVGALGYGGCIYATAGADGHLSGGLLDARGSSTDGLGGAICVTTGRNILADGSSKLLASGNLAGGGNSGGGSVDLTGCQVSFPTGSKVQAKGGQTGGQITMTASDVLSLGGVVDAASGTVNLTTRLVAPFSPLLTGAVSPNPTVVHDLTLPPSLSILDISVQSSAPAAGAPWQVSLHSTPNAGVLVLVGLVPGYLPLGPFGVAQLDPSTSFRLADPGLLGAPLPGSSTDSSGNWSVTTPLIGSPNLAGLQLLVEAYVVDPNALNGAFQQAPLVTVTF